jgi:phosphatidylserine synthase
MNTNEYIFLLCMIIMLSNNKYVVKIETKKFKKNHPIFLLDIIHIVVCFMCTYVCVCVCVYIYVCV